MSRPRRYCRCSIAIAPKYMTTTEQVGRAMIKVARDGYPKPVLESEDINRAVAVSSRMRNPACATVIGLELRRDDG